MRIAIIDLGTNSVRFDVHQLAPGRRVRQLHREKIMVRLGQGVFLNGKLDRHAIQRTLHAFSRFKKIAAQYRASKIIAFGTSALREVSDRERFLKTVQEKTGIEIRVISGVEEAQLIALGVLSLEKLRKERIALVDIGGGSTEISICQGREVLQAMSFPLGTARLQQVFLKKSPPSPASLFELRHFIKGTLSKVILAEHWPQATRVVGSSGTIKALAKMLKSSDEYTIDRAALSSLVNQMSTMNTTELLGLDGMESKRVDMILAGAILFEECMEVLGVKKAVTTQFSLRDGILEEELRLYEQGGVSHLQLHVGDLIEKAKQFGADAKHLHRMTKLAETLFDELAPLHKLKPGWRLYLTAATLLRNTGEAINLSRLGEHSYYIVKNADFPGAEAWETEFVAELCRQHEGIKIERDHLAFLKGKSRKETFAKLLAMLRLVDALDSGAEAHIRIKKVEIQRGEVVIDFGGTGLTGMESFNIERRAPTFEKVFKRSFVARARGR